MRILIIRKVDIMANVQYSGVRESKLGRVNDLGTTGKEVEENFRKGLTFSGK